MFSEDFATQILEMILQGKAIPNFCDNAASSPATQLYVSLHTADPGSGGAQTASECTYTGYARVAVARSDSAWTVADGEAENASAIEFEQCTGGSNQATWFAVGTEASGTGRVVLRGQLSGGGLAISNGVKPRFAAGKLVALLEYESA